MQCEFGIEISIAHHNKLHQQKQISSNWKWEMLLNSLFRELDSSVPNLVEAKQEQKESRAYKEVTPQSLSLRNWTLVVRLQSMCQATSKLT